LLAYTLPTANQNLIADYDVDNKTLSLGANIGGSNLLIVTSEGEVVTTQGPPPLTQATYFKERAEMNGYEVDFTSIWEVEKTEDEIIENWSSSIILKG
jgi:hypothetical protein